MKKTLIGIFVLLVCFSLFLIVGLSSQKSESEKASQPRSPGIYTPEEVFENSSSDIFLIWGTVYTNASDIDWVQQQHLTIGREVGEITRVYKEGESIEGVVSTQLPEGTKIYEPKEKATNGNILIAKLNGKEIRYLALVEG